MDRAPRIMRVLATALTLVGCGAGERPEGAQSAGGDPSSGFVGSWQLESWHSADGTPRCDASEGPAAGQIIYTADGHMSAQLGCLNVSPADPEVADAAASAADVRARLVRRHFSYYGGYTVDRAAGTVTHHVAGSVSAAWVGTDRVRHFTFLDGDRIELVTPEGQSRLVWRRSGR